MEKRAKMLLKNKVLVNGVWLYALQFFNTVVPLLTLPYVTRILGSERYGVFSFALNLTTYFQVIVEYGFNLSGARKIALVEDDDSRSKIYTRITSSKLILCFISLIIMVCVAFFTGINKMQFNCMAILYTMVIGSAIQQIWLFQGMQKMEYVTIINVISRSISVILIFIFIKDSNDLYLYSIFYAITSLLIGIFSAAITKYKLKIKLSKVNIKEIYSELADGWHVFTTSAMSKIFTGIGITVLGFSSTNESLIGVYAAIQKIPYIMTLMYAPIGQAIFPYISKEYSNSFQIGLNKVKQIAKVLIPIIFISGLLLILNSKLIIEILYGMEYAPYSILMVPMIFWLFFSILNNILGIQILVASGHLKEYSVAFKIGMIAIILFNVVLGNKFGVYGVANATMIAEIILTLANIYQINKVIKNK